MTGQVKVTPARADTTPVGDRAGGWLRAASVVAVLLLLPALGLDGRGAGPAGLPERIHLYVAVPADADIRYAVADAALHEAELAMAWVEAQTGRQLQRRPVDFAEIVTLQVPADALVGDVRAAFATIHAELVAHAGDPEVFPLILADVRTESATRGLLTCGLGGVTGVVLFLGNCPDDDLSTDAAWGSAASITIAHELVHGLGAVADCAPHSDGVGHVVDDPFDILHAGLRPDASGISLVMDAGRDDYLGHRIAGCPDVADSPLWRR